MASAQASRAREVAGRGAGQRAYVYAEGAAYLVPPTSSLPHLVRWAPSRGEMSARCQPSVASGAKESGLKCVVVACGGFRYVGGGAPSSLPFLLWLYAFFLSFHVVNDALPRPSHYHPRRPPAGCQKRTNKPPQSAKQTKSRLRTPGARALLPATRSRASGQLEALLSSPVLGVRLMTALQVLQVRDHIRRNLPGASGPHTGPPPNAPLQSNVRNHYTHSSPFDARDARGCRVCSRACLSAVPPRNSRPWLREAADA